MNTTYANAVIESKLPSEIRDLSRQYDNKLVAKILHYVAKNAPHTYQEVVHELLQVGNKHHTYSGLSFNYATEFEAPKERDTIVNKTEKEVQAIVDSRLPEHAKQEKITQIFLAAQKQLEEAVVTEHKSKDSLMYRHFASGAKGNPSQMRMTTGAVMGVTDYKDRPIPITIKKSYAEGLDPHEMFAASYGARKGLMSTKMATADTGAFEKALTMLNIATVITEADCGTENGVMYPVTDMHNIDKFLAASAGPFKRNELITEETLGVLGKKGISQIRVRTPLTCEAEEGLCAKCFGLNEKGQVPFVGENVGIDAAHGMGQPITQMALHTKHTGGAAGSKTVSSGGFPAIRQLLTVPKNFPGEAVLAPHAGVVSKIRPAPQGGHYLFIGQDELYIPVDVELTAKPGETVEVGDRLTTGLINPSRVAELQGIGAARKALVASLREQFEGQKLDTPRRHFEITARNLLSHAEATGLDAGHLPGDVFRMTGMKELDVIGKHEVSVDQAMGKYLAKNYLHHTIGTKVLPQIIKELKDAGVKKLVVVDKEPSFQPKVVRIQAVPLLSEDFVARLGSSYIKDTMQEAAHFGLKSKVHNTLNPVPAFGYGAEFGQDTKFY